MTIFLKSFFTSCLLLTLLYSQTLYSRTLEVKDEIETINLSLGVEHDYQLPREYKNLKIKMSGNYTRYATSLYIKSKNNIRFKPLRQGQGVLVIKDQKNKILRQINIDVTRLNLHKIVKELKELLIAVDGIAIKIINNRVVVDGEILLPRDMDRIKQVLAQYGDKKVASLVTFSPKAQNQIASLITKEIGMLGDESFNNDPSDGFCKNSVTVKAAYNRFILEGEVDDLTKKDKAQLIAELYTQFDTSLSKQSVRKKDVNAVTNLINVCKSKPPDNTKSLIQIVVHYVELQKNYNKGFTFQWTPLMSGDGTSVSLQAGGGVASFAALLTTTISNFFPKLNWAKSFNFARVLHNATVLVEEGQQASIASTTTVPLPQTAADGSISTTNATQSTVETQVVPTLIGPNKGTIHMRVGFTVANPLGAQAVSSKRISTIVHVADRKTVALGGLISSNLARDYNRLPNSATTGGLPIVNLVSSKNYGASKSQFVVFISPSKMINASLGSKKIMKNFKILDKDN